MSGIDVKVISVLLPSYQIIRLGAYWNQIEPEPGLFLTDDLDWQIEAAERAGKQIILLLKKKLRLLEKPILTDHC